MSGTWSFFCYELRRHLPTLAVGSALLLAGPAIHRLVEGRWNYWDGEWNVAGAAVAVFAITPLLALGMAISGWASERAAGELEWLYARPLSAARIFWPRLAAAAAATTAWIAAALLVNGVSPAELFAWSASWKFPAGLGLVLIVFFLVGGFWASALFQSPGAAFQGFLVTALVLGVLVPFLVLLLSPTTTALLVGGSQLLSLAGRLGGGAMALALLVGAWVAMRRSPADPGRLPRALRVAGALAVVAVAAVIPLVLLPLQVDSTRVQGVHWLGEGTTLELRPARGIATPLGHPILRYRDGSERPLRRSFTFAQAVFAHPGRGMAIMQQLTAGIPQRGRDDLEWLAVDRQGEVRSFELPVYERPRPICWSHRGSYFAWRTQSYQGQARVSSGLMILNEDLRLDWRQIQAPSSDWTAAWIDDQRLLLTPRWDFQEQAGWWMVISADGREQMGPHPLPEGAFLFPVALGLARKWPPIGGTFRPLPLALRGSELVVLLSNGRDDARLANLDLGRGELDPGPAIAWPGGLRTDPRGTMGFLASFGTLADGSLLWAEPASLEQTRILRMPPPAIGEPTEICTVEDRTFHLGGRFRGATGSWALWGDIHEARLIACHLETGEVRVLDDLGPLGTHSADVVDDGVVTIRGKIFLD